MWDKEQEKQEKKNNDQTNETKHLVMEGGWLNERSGKVYKQLREMGTKAQPN